MNPTARGWVTVRLNTTAATFAGIPLTPATWNDTEDIRAYR